MRRSKELAVIAVFSSLIVGSDFALYPFYNVKLLDTLVFVAAYAFGMRVGASIAVISETAWSFASPIGMAGAITPFLVAGELLFAVAGWWASKVWGDRAKLLTPNSIFIGALMLVCAFLWDLETNMATALLVPSSLFLEVMVAGIPFAAVHEAADFFLGMAVAPAAILAIPKLMRGKA
ncbi:MAG: hypothetical protein HY297_00300 [Thaumarchaeota archaeon]|nr:hypothetical protein [Nitrososphaerota archaeon]